MCAIRDAVREAERISKRTVEELNVFEPLPPPQRMFPVFLFANKFDVDQLAVELEALSEARERLGFVGGSVQRLAVTRMSRTGPLANGPKAPISFSPLLRPPPGFLRFFPTT